MGKKKSASTEAKKSAPKKSAPKKQEPKEEIVNATTPDFLPASHNPGGIPVLDSNNQPVGDPRTDSPAADPGRNREAD